MSLMKSEDLPVLIKKCLKLSFFIVRSSRHNVNKTAVCFAVYYSTVQPLFLVYFPLTAGSLTLTSLSGLFFLGFYGQNLAFISYYGLLFCVFSIDSKVSLSHH